jgi:hypothetical protein
VDTAAAAAAQAAAETAKQDELDALFAAELGVPLKKKQAPKPSATGKVMSSHTTQHAAFFFCSVVHTSFSP